MVTVVAGKLMGLNNYFLIGFKDWSTKGNTCSVLESGQNVRLGSSWTPE